MSMLRLILLVVLLLPQAGHSLLADDRDDELPGDLLEIMGNRQPSFMVRVEVDRPSCSYREGDAMRIRVASEEDAYIYAFYQPAEGKTYQVFPNRFQPNNLLKARQAVQIPADDDFFRWQVSAPFGKETIKVVATRQPIASLSAPELTRERFNEISPEAVKGIALELGKEDTAEWAEDDVVVHTYPNQETPEIAKSRRWGVYFGVSKHMFARHRRLAKQIEPDEFKHESESGGDLWACHRDARKLAQRMQEIGRMDGVKVFTNDNATKQNMEDAITRWLPSVSRPGDTVFIYYSGHTGQLDDESGDEKDGKDEFLVPHDAFGPAAWLACHTLLQNKEAVLRSGILGPRHIKQMEQYHAVGQQVAERHGSLMALIEYSFVTDDLMAHWLQRLAGRQVVFISDSCHSAGFAQEVGGAANANQPPLDFLQNEIGRLKELGQENQAILTAALADQYAYELRDKSMGVMTHFLSESMLQSSDALKIEDAFKAVEAGMKAYYEQNQQTGSEPYLLNNCRLPIYLKP